VPIAAVALGALGLAHLARAGNPLRDPDVTQVSYTTSRSGAQLEWLPSRSASVHRDNQLVRTAHSESTTDADKASRPASGKSDPFSDPFGDGKPRMLPTAQSGQVTAKALGEVILPNDSAPDFPPSAKTSTTDRRVAVDVQQPGAKGPPLEPNIGGVPRSTHSDEEVPRRTREQEDRELAAGREDVEDPCPSSNETTPLSKINLNPRHSAGKLPRECPLGSAEFSGRNWGPITYTWTASALCHKPLVFEEPQLERYGHALRPVVQPFASAAHFFVCVPAIPYILGIEPWNECVYTLGYYRPGSCAPYTIDPLPISLRAVLAEATVVTGIAIAMP
jgi:hypothetical protein